MALWHLVVLFSFATPLVSSIEAARTFARDWSSYGLALVVGICIGAIGAWAMGIAFAAARRRFGAGSLRPWKLPEIYLGGVVWGCLLGVAAFCLTRKLS